VWQISGTFGSVFNVVRGGFAPLPVSGIIVHSSHWQNPPFTGSCRVCFLLILPPAHKKVAESVTAGWPVGHGAKIFRIFLCYGNNPACVIWQQRPAGFDLIGFCGLSRGKEKRDRPGLGVFLAFRSGRGKPETAGRNLFLKSCDGIRENFKKIRAIARKILKILRW
jgi:hypothetical protein